VPEQGGQGEEFATAEQVLLCCFGVHPRASSPRSAKQLRQALVEAGFRSSEARHLVRDSALLRATLEGQYALRPFDDAPAGR
jgi:hypothetical protein